MRALPRLLLPLLFGCAHALPAASPTFTSDSYSVPVEGDPTELSVLVKELAGRPELVHDERLDRAAELLANAWAESEVMPPTQYVEQLVLSFGLAGYSQFFGGTLSGKSRDRERTLKGWLTQNVAKSLRPDCSAFGVAIGGGGAHPSVVRVVCVHTAVAHDPLRRRYAPGEAITLSGVVQQRSNDALLAFPPGSSTPEEVPVVDGHFSVIWRAPQAPGQYVGELMRAVPYGVPLERGRSVLRLRFVVGVKESFDPTPAPEPLDALAPFIAAHINGLRAQAGLKPLSFTADADLDTQAQQLVLLDKKSSPPPEPEGAPTLRLTLDDDPFPDNLVDMLARPACHARFLSAQLETLSVAPARKDNRWALVVRAR
jgi:hypothetical protein